MSEGLQALQRKGGAGSELLQSLNVSTSGDDGRYLDTCCVRWRISLNIYLNSFEFLSVAFQNFIVYSAPEESCKVGIIV